MIADYGGVYEKLEMLHNTYGVKTVIDSAFNLESNNFLLKSSQTENVCNVAEFQKAHGLISFCQMSEWGMHQIQALFPRLTDKINYEERGQRISG